MNYLSHSAAFLDRPPVAVGSVLPDLMSAIDRKCRVRQRHVERVLSDPTLDDRLRPIVIGLRNHLEDDHWFHGTEAFVTTSSAVARMLRAAMPDDPSHRIGFLGHILVELLLDAWIERKQPGTVDGFYEAFRSIDPVEAERAVNLCASRPTERLAGFWDRFADERFLADYVTDAGLFMRVNHVLKRVKLPPLDAPIIDVLADARTLVEVRAAELLPPRVVDSLASNDGDPSLPASP